MNSNFTSLPEPLLAGTPRQTNIEFALGIGVADHPGHPSLRKLGNFAIPQWQRDPVWEKARQIAFIEGIFLGLGTGHFVASKADWDNDGPMPLSALLIDGQQRLTALARFHAGDFAVFGQIRFPDLPLRDRRRRFLHVAFPWIEIPGDNEATLKELYRRLNFGGVPHTNSDLARLDPWVGDLRGLVTTPPAAGIRASP
ncbi:DUF262 domain-containing protein [Paraburkholderia sp. J8-2]|uniref:DUF262 domain-containing protein n=1 Tax=Paraburkholderia sp. J8-2 TaxID=2805440 RepID=UPI002AB61567|nr:DUF262 domain-containing protein [Paraburkholderia sp. J8-2]